MSPRIHARKEEPKRTRTCQDFLDKWMPWVRHHDLAVEIDYAFKDDAITVTDMRIPSALRTGVLYTRHEVEAGEDDKRGDFQRRVDEFMAQALRGR